MKHFSFFILAAMAFLAICTMPTFSSCSEDALDGQEQPLTKADVLRAKAKEFAKKYNVDMTLNEENIDSLAEVLTVEQMERDFQKFASMEITCRPINASQHLATKSRRLIIRKTLKLSEEKKEEIKTGNATQDISLSLTYEKIDEKGNHYTEYESLKCEASLKWKYEGDGKGSAEIEIKSLDGNETIGSKSLHAQFVGGNQASTVEFTASDTISLKIKDYSITKNIYVKFTEPYNLSIYIS